MKNQKCPYFTSRAVRPMTARNVGRAMWLDRSNECRTWSFEVRRICGRPLEIGRAPTAMSMWW